MNPAIEFCWTVRNAQCVRHRLPAWRFASNTEFSLLQLGDRLQRENNKEAATMPTEYELMIILAVLTIACAAGLAKDMRRSK